MCSATSRSKAPSSSGDQRWSDPSGKDHELVVTAKDYVKAVAQHLGRRHLSPADASLALSWHAAGVPLRTVISEVRRAAASAADNGRSRRSGAPPLRRLAAAVEAKAIHRASSARLPMRADWDSYFMQI